MTIVRTVDQMRHVVRGWRLDDESVGFVPTMGFLHDGHLSLVDCAHQNADRVVVSIYVNPTQFGPNEDLARYPRDLDHDEACCRRRGVDALFYPDDDMMYAEDHSTWVVEEGLSAHLCGRSRPTHFRGVTTVVTKLFNIVQPDCAVFGRKDAQQALIVERMVRDLNMPVRIITAPIVREADGLAMSSRNRYLTDDQRRRALSISRGMNRALDLYEHGTVDAATLRARVRDSIETADGRVDYVELVGRDDLQPLAVVDRPALLAAAAYFGDTRLIDNVYLG